MKIKLLLGAAVAGILTVSVSADYVQLKDVSSADVQYFYSGSNNSCDTTENAFKDIGLNSNNLIYGYSKAYPSLTVEKIYGITILHLNDGSGINMIFAQSLQHCNLYKH